jgi:hypothetical protein
MGTEGPPETILAYETRFEDWDHRASVRAKPRAVISPDEAADRLYFTPELVPAVQHPLVARLGPSTLRDLLVHHLYLHLCFTVTLEHDVVGPVARRIASRVPNLTLPGEMIFDAHRLYCDETYHALFCADLARQVQALTRIEPVRAAPPPFLRRLRMIERSGLAGTLPLLRTFFAIVSETLISSTLSRVPHDGRVIAAIRQTLRHHADDEGRHHAYFASVFPYLWRSLAARQRVAVGMMLPQFIFSFLEPDHFALKCLLLKYGLTNDEAEAVRAEAYPVAQSLAEARQAARATLRLFEAHGVFNDAAIADAFRTTGLLD